MRGDAARRGATRGGGRGAPCSTTAARLSGRCSRSPPRMRSMGDADRADAAYLESAPSTRRCSLPSCLAAGRCGAASGGGSPPERSKGDRGARAGLPRRSLALFELWAWHDAARYGAAAEAAAALAAMVDRVDPPLPAVFAARATAAQRTGRPGARRGAASSSSASPRCGRGARQRHGMPRARGPATCAACSAALETMRARARPRRHSRRCAAASRLACSQSGSSRSLCSQRAVARTPRSPQSSWCPCGPSTPTFDPSIQSSASPVAPRSPGRWIGQHSSLQ